MIAPHCEKFSILKKPIRILPEYEITKALPSLPDVRKLNLSGLKTGTRSPITTPVAQSTKNSSLTFETENPASFSNSPIKFKPYIFFTMQWNSRSPAHAKEVLIRNRINIANFIATHADWGTL